MRAVALIMVGSREEHLDAKSSGLADVEMSEGQSSDHEGIQKLEVQEDWETMSSANSRNVAKV